MRRVTLLGVAVGLMVALVAGCGGQSGGSSGGTSVKSGKAYSPDIRPADFSDVIDNKFFPLDPGTTFIYEGGSERDVMAVTSDTKEIMGVKCVVVDDRGYAGGNLIEKTYDWFAQDDKGNVWYFGEDTKELDNGKVTSTHGSWEAGVDGAKPGIIMQGDPKIGESYRQEYYKGEAEDTAEVVSLDESATVPYGSFDRVLETREWTPLEPSYDEHKYYAAGVGQVSGGGLELVEVNHG